MAGFGSLAQTPEDPYPEQGAGMPETYQSPAGRALTNIGVGLIKTIWGIPERLGTAAAVPAGLRREDVTDVPAQRSLTGTARFGAEPQDELVEGTTGSAINRIGTGLPFAPRGAGVFGGKLAKPVEAAQSEVPHQSPYEGWHEAMEGIKAYHGSPHDFDRFDVSKIGTGEGAQTYGHGLYFAENENVAKSYRDNLGVTPKVNSFNWNPDGTPNRAGQVASQLDAKISEHEIQQGLRVLEPNATQAQIDGWIKAGHDIYADAQKSGRMYEVNIKADPKHFLDWDKPLSQMSPEVQKKLNDAWLAHPEVHANQTGEEIYQNAEISHHQPGEGHLDKVIVAEKLREAGIPGIKYLDQGSRFQPQQVEHLQNQISQLQDMARQNPDRADIAKALAGRQDELRALKPSHNYVVFNDKLIDILRKYGWAGLVGSAGLLGGANGDRPSSQ